MFNKPKLAIAFDTIVDEDFGLIKLIFNQYLDPSIFDLDKFKRSGIEVIKELYMREEINPLLSFTLPNINKEEADSLYNEFISTKYDDIIDRSIGTNMQLFLRSAIDSKEFEIVIFCYTEDQLRIANEIDEFKSVSKVLFNKDLWESCYQFYFKYLYQSYSLKNVTGYHFYYSTIGPNLNKDRSDIKLSDEINKIRKSNYLSLYDLYNIKNPFEEERETNDEL